MSETNQQEEQPDVSNNGASLENTISGNDSSVGDRNYLVRSNSTTDPPKTMWKETQPFKSQSKKQFIDNYSPKIQSDNSITLSTSLSERDLLNMEKESELSGSIGNSTPTSRVSSLSLSSRDRDSSLGVTTPISDPNNNNNNNNNNSSSNGNTTSNGKTTPGLGINLTTWFSGWKSKGSTNNSAANSVNNSNNTSPQLGNSTGSTKGNTSPINNNNNNNNNSNNQYDDKDEDDELDNICNNDISSQSTSDKVIIREGYLNKQGHLRKNWLRRYFILTCSHLEYYNKDKEKGLINKIPLSECDISMADIEIKKSHCFKLTHRGTKRSFYLFSNERPSTAEFEKDSYEWIGAIQEVIDILKNQSQVERGQSSTPNLVTEGHRSYELVHCISHALLYSLGKISAALLTDICLEDFQSSESINVNKEQSLGNSSGGNISNGNSNSNDKNSNNDKNNTSSNISSSTSQYSYKFTDYAPKVFRKIRELSNVNSADYMISLTQNNLIEEASQGRSNSFFYFTSDKKLLIKTITTSEYEQLRAILPNYYFHLLQNPDSLIIRFFGLHYISPSKMKNTYFVVMENIFSTVEMDEVYDLKGSTLNRKANGKKVLMDLDFCTRIFISEDLKLKFYKQIESDCNFLEKNGSMDYSLLLGIHYLKGKRLEESDVNSGGCSSPSLFRKELGGMIARTSTGELYDKIYYLSIIDILTVYNIKKQIEHTYKSVAYDSADAMSAVDPSTYNKRFKQYVQKVTGWNIPNNK